MAKITNPSKLLPSSKSTTIVKVGKSNIIAKTSPLSKGLLAKKENTDANNKLVKVDKFLKSDLLVSKKKAEVKRKDTEKQDFEEAEKKLETPQSKKFKLPGISAPSLGFMDRVKRFIFFTALGWALPKILEFLPKLQGFANIIGGVYNFAEGLFGKLFDGFMSLVKFGGDLKDKTLGFIATAKGGVGGNYQKEFDKLEKQFNTFVNASIIAGVLAADIGSAAVDEYNKQRKRGQKPEPGKPAAKAGAKVTTGRGGEKPKGKPKVTTGKGGKVPGWWNKIFKGPFAKLKGPLSRFAGAAVPGLGAAVGAADAAARFKAGDKIGGALASVSSGLDAITTVLALTGVGLPAAAIFGGVSIGIDVILLIRDIAKTFFPFIPMFSGGGRVVRRYQGGGTTRGGRPVGTSKRRGITPAKKIKQIRPPKSQPGRDVGGEGKIKRLYPNTGKRFITTQEWRDSGSTLSYNEYLVQERQNEGKKPNPYKALTTTAKILKDIPLVGGIMGAAVDIALGQKPDVNVYRSLSAGIGSLVENLANQKANNSISSLTRDIKGFAEGGNVPASRELKGDYRSLSSGDMIAKVLGPTIDQRVNEAIQSIQKELQKRREGTAGQPPGPDDTPGARLRDGSNAQIEADLLEYYTALYGKNAAIGIVANLRRESGYRTATPNNTRFEGMAQWSRNDRWPKFVKWAENKGLNPYDRNAQAQYVAVELKQLGTDKRIVQAKTPEEAASIFYNEFERGAHSKRVKGNSYNPDNPHENKNKAFVQDISGRNPDIGKRTSQVVVPSRPTPSNTGYAPRSPGNFNAVEYITGDPSQSANYDLDGHGLQSNYHDHIAFRTEADKERAKKALRDAGIKIGSEYRPGDDGYHGANLAIDVPGYQWGGTGAIGQKEYEGSKKVRSILGLQAGGLISPRKPNRPIPNSFASYETYGSGMVIAIQPIIVEKQVPVSGGGNKMIAFPVPVAVNSNIDNAFLGG